MLELSCPQFRYNWDECNESAKERDQVAGNARKDVEKRLGRSTISKENLFPKKKEKKKIKWSQSPTYKIL